MHEKLNIRPAVISDMENVFHLSNDDLVRKNSINKEKIKWENHIQWFQNRIQNTKYPFYVVETDKGDFVGQIRFDNQDGDIVASVSISPEFRGFGLGAEIIKMALQKSKFDRVVAYIYQDNIGSIKSFEKAGFKKSDLLKFIYDEQSN